MRKFFASLLAALVAAWWLSPIPEVTLALAALSAYFGFSFCCDPLAALCTSVAGFAAGFVAVKKLRLGEKLLRKRRGRQAGRRE